MTKLLFIIILCSSQLFAQFVSGGSRRAIVSSGGGPTQVFSDSFSYSNGDLVVVSGGNWTYTTGAKFLVTSPFVIPNQDTAYAFARWSGTGTPTTNQYSTVHYSALSVAILGPAVRVPTSGSNTGYSAACTASGCFIVKLINGTITSLTSTGAPIAIGDTIELDATGTTPTVLTIKLTHSGITSAYQTATDSSSPLTTGTWGIGGRGFASDGMYSNNVTGGNL
jgi:hypothetical protein